VTGVKDDPLDAAATLARDIAAKSPQAIQAMKKMFDELWHPREAAFLRLEAELQTSLMGSSNQVEAVMANLQKRAPDFKDP